MTVDLPTVRRHVRRPTLATYVVRVGADRIPIRAAAVWPIADVLEAVTRPDSASTSDGPSGDASMGLMLDLIDSGMITPPRPRRRRQRAVSSRAIFYVTRD